MRRIMKFEAFINEKAIMPTDFSEMLEELRRATAYRPLQINQVNPITQPHGVTFVNYDDFYAGLPDNLKSTAPPRNTPLFGFIDANNNIKIVISIPFIGIRELPFINHMIQHESVHIGQWHRRAGNVDWTLPDPNDRKSYFSNKDEIMAFSQSVVEMMINNQGVRNFKDVPEALKRNPLWNDIKGFVDTDVQNRYLKYIYEYSKNYLNPESETDEIFRTIMSSRRGLSEGLNYHLENEIPLSESVYRIGSDSWIAMIDEARSLWESGEIELNEDDLFLISTDAGQRAIYEGSDVLLEIPFENEEVDEEEYQGKKVDLNKPFRTSGGPRKFSVYTKDNTGKVVKVNFGQPGMRVNNADPEKARSFRKRMVCEKPGPKWKAKYWACNVGRYAKLLGLSSSRPW